MRLVPKVIYKITLGIVHTRVFGQKKENWYDCLQCLLLQV